MPRTPARLALLVVPLAVVAAKAVRPSVNARMMNKVRFINKVLQINQFSRWLTVPPANCGTRGPNCPANSGLMSGLT